MQIITCMKNLFHSFPVAVPGEHGDGELVYAQAMFIGKAGLGRSNSHGAGKLISYDLGAYICHSYFCQKVLGEV